MKTAAEAHNLPKSQEIIAKMIPEYLLPATVVLLKLFFRLFVGQSATKVDIAKAALAFPIDLAFLAISFSAVFLGYMQARVPDPLSTGAALGVFVLYILVAGCVTVLVKKSDGAFLIDKLLVSIGWTVPAYLISGFAIFTSIWIWGA